MNIFSRVTNLFSSFTHQCNLNDHSIQLMTTPKIYLGIFEPEEELAFCLDLFKAFLITNK
jgi:hypothetical protein